MTLVFELQLYIMKTHLHPKGDLDGRIQDSPDRYTPDWKHYLLAIAGGNYTMPYILLYDSN